MIALRPLKRSEFADSAPAANPVFYRTYSRKKEDGTRESFTEVCDRVIEGLSELGEFNAEEEQLVERLLQEKKMLPSGRWLWVGGTDWIKDQKNFPVRITAHPLS